VKTRCRACHRCCYRTATTVHLRRGHRRRRVVRLVTTGREIVVDVDRVRTRRQPLEGQPERYHEPLGVFRVVLVEISVLPCAGSPSGSVRTLVEVDVRGTRRCRLEPDIGRAATTPVVRTRIEEGSGQRDSRGLDQPPPPISCKGPGPAAHRGSWLRVHVELPVCGTRPKGPRSSGGPGSVLTAFVVDPAGPDSSTLDREMPKSWRTRRCVAKPR
jgi:hypothetical protein